jgi:putative DNA primase/helicase
MLTNLENACLENMAKNGIPYRGKLITNTETVQRWTADNKKSKDEWYIAHEGISDSGSPYLICIYGSWSQGKKVEYRSWQDGSGWLPKKEELPGIQANVTRLKQIAERERLQTQQKAAQKAEHIYRNASQFPENEDHRAYFEKKKITAEGEPRYGYRGTPETQALILPLRNVEGEIRSLQYIWVDAEGKTHKRFESGGEKQGNFMPLKPYFDAEELYICEGYATGVSIQKATHRPVIVAFDAGNLEPVVANLIKKHPDKRFIICADNDREKPINKGIQAAKAIQEKYGCTYTYPDTGCVLDGVTDFNDLQVAFGTSMVKQQLEDHETKGGQVEENWEGDADEIIEWDEYPIEAFPENIRNYMQEIVKKVQVSNELVGGNVLATMSTAVQNLGDVNLGSHTAPLSLFSLSVAESGERKTAVMKHVLKPFQQKGMKLNEQYNQEMKIYNAKLEGWRKEGKKKDAIDLITHYQNEPEKPKSPKLIIKDPTIEGIGKQFKEGYPSIGLFNDEAGQIFGGFSMGKDRTIHGITSFSCLWDGTPFERTKAGEFEATSMYNKRLSASLALQPSIFFETVWSNQMMTDQGFLARFLIADCPSLAGSRVIREREERINEVIESHYIGSCLAGVELMIEGFKIECIDLSSDAQKIRHQAEVDIEEKLQEFGEYHNKKPFAAKMLEQAIRIAGVLSLFDNLQHIQRQKPNHWMIAAEYMSGGLEIASWYMQQISKLYDREFEEETDSRETKVLSLVESLQKENPGGATLREICQKVPRTIGRKKEKVLPIIEKLHQQGKIISVKIGKKEGWKITA